jgi:hypothetical protein
LAEFKNLAPYLPIADKMADVYSLPFKPSAIYNILMAVEDGKVSKEEAIQMIGGPIVANFFETDVHDDGLMKLDTDICQCPKCALIFKPVPYVKIEEA